MMARFIGGPLIGLASQPIGGGGGGGQIEARGRKSIGGHRGAGGQTQSALCPSLRGSNSSFNWLA